MTITRTILLAALLTLTLSAEEPKVSKHVCREYLNSDQKVGMTIPCPSEAAKLAPTKEQLQAKIVFLEAQLSSTLADKKLLELTMNLELQVCNLPELMSTKLKAKETREAFLALQKSEETKKK